MRSIYFMTLMISEATLSAQGIANELRPILIRLARELRRETEQLGVTGRQAALLWEIRSLSGLNLSELAAVEGISAPALSGHVDRLERLGLVARTRATDDRRRIGLRLTKDGDRLLRRIRARRTTWLAARLDLLTTEDLAAVHRALPSLQRVLDEEPAA
jgi:DNA-binding MarR family transcriptional regulator